LLGSKIRTGAKTGGGGGGVEAMRAGLETEEKLSTHNIKGSRPYDLKRKCLGAKRKCQNLQPVQEKGRKE